MDFINTYFNMKFGAIGRLLELTRDAVYQRMWLGVILAILWTVFCTIGGILLTPIDIIVCAIMWYKCQGAREEMEEVVEELLTD